MATASPSSTEPSPPQGDLTLVGRLVDASNGTFLARDETEVQWLYKPVRGEAPLRDFPDQTLGRREVAAFQFSAAAGFDLVPPTFWHEGPFGVGSAQLWLEGAATDLVDLVLADQVPSESFGMVIGEDRQGRDVALIHADDPRLRRMALFDVLVNNADRKGSHIIHVAHDSHDLASPDVIRGVDHGLTFHVDDKLRTVLWGWAGQPLTEQELALVGAGFVAAGEVLGEWLDHDEVTAAEQRAADLLADQRFPAVDDRWPLYPWPPL